MRGCATLLGLADARCPVGGRRSEELCGDLAWLTRDREGTIIMRWSILVAVDSG
jgi:hypothetical protein